MMQKPVFEAVSPLFPSMVTWIQAAFAEYFDAHDLEDQLDLGATHRALYVHQKTLKRMRIEPQVRPPFRPAEVQQLEFLYYDGVDADVAILFKKLHRRRGRLCSSGWLTFQQRERRSDQLLFDGRKLYVLVCGYTVAESLEQHVALDHIYIGHEAARGFDWAHTLWSRQDGLIVPTPQDQPMLFADVHVRIRRDVAATESTSKVGVNRRKKAEGKAPKRSGRLGA